jgi:hypothetical protein
MSQMLMSQIPGFFDLADSAIAGGQPLTDYALAKISQNAKFGAVRCEILFVGYYANGDTVRPPVSPVDGYAYTYPECLFLWQAYSTTPPQPGYAPGQATPPAVGAATSRFLYKMIWDVNDANGMVSLVTHYWNADNDDIPTNDGTVKVFAVCQRLSVNLPAGVSGD